jgi:hypothetical protein
VIPGPLPQREKRRRNKPTRPTVTVPGNADALTWPPADPDWHPLAAELYASLPKSAQSSMFEPSDVAAARVIIEGLHRTLTASRWSPTAYAAIVAQLDGLGATVGARLRLRLDVEKPSTVEPPSAAALRRYRVVAGADADV